MKTLIVSLLACVIFSKSFCQETQTTSPVNGQDYLQKSRNQKTGAWVLLGAGAALTAGGLIWFSNELDLFNSDNDSNEDIAVIVSGVGVAAMGGSIPLFIASARNKKKALQMNAGLRLEKRDLIKRDVIANQVYPALSFRIQFR